MSQWIHTDHDFGLPAVTFLISVREVVTAAHAGDGDLRQILNDDNPKRMAEEIAKFIHHFHPSLDDGKGCVVGIRMTGGLTFHIDYYHPKLKRIKCGQCPPEKSLIQIEGLIDLFDNDQADEVEIPGPTVTINTEQVGIEGRRH